jgi:hypothetical protein
VVTPARRPRASDEFFRPTGPAAAAVSAAPSGRAGSGREHHDAKITVYLSNAELLDLERLRLDLRADHGVVVDRGRLVREAIALALSDVADHGSSGALVQRLRQR